MSTITRWLAARLYKRIHARVAARRAPDFIIGEPDQPYMLRWWMIPRNRWFNVYLHHVLRDDEDRALHDHPWASVSLTLRGVLAEVYVDRRGVSRVREMRRGSVVWRSARFTHRLFLPVNHECHADAWTLFITGPVVREWGFACPAGWRHWKEFTAVRAGDKGRIGRGCE